MRSARLTRERFEPRQGFDPNYLAEPRRSRLWHAGDCPRKFERGARALTDKSALADVTFKTEDWLLSRGAYDRGETVVLEPDTMRRPAARAQALQSELGSARAGSARQSEPGTAPPARPPQRGQRPAVRLGDRTGEPQAET